MEEDLSESVKICTKYLDSDNEGDEERTHNCSKLYRYPWEENKHTLKNVFSRLDPAIKEARDKLGPYIYTKRVSSSLGWVLMKSCSGKWYFGQWNKKTRVREGVGVYADNIKIYEGYWRNGKAHWRGRRINIDGNYYEGNFQDYEYHGNGLYVDKDGTSYNGQWKNGKKHGLGVQQNKDGSIYEGIFIEGVAYRTGVKRKGNQVMIGKYNINIV